MAEKTKDAKKAKDTKGIDEMRVRYDAAEKYWAPKYAAARDDIRFVVVPGEQWDKALVARRRGRPVYEFPKLRMHTLQVINEAKQNRPQGKVRGTEESDRGLAEIMQGLCRNIEATSNADRAYDIGYEPAVQGGIGCWRICTDYRSDDDFDQDIFIKAMRNPFASLPDPSAQEWDRRDANYWFVREKIPKAQFESEHPDADITEFFRDPACKTWIEDGTVQRAEYWYKERRQRELLAIELPTGAREVVYADEAKLDAESAAQAGIKILRTRMVDSHKVFMRLTNGHEWLSEPYEFPSKFIPIVLVWGNLQNIDGEEYFSGMVRYGKDSQRLHNVHRTAMIEAVAKAPKAPFLVTADQIKGYEAMWNRANADDTPYLLYNKDKNEQGPPQRTSQAEVPAALIQLAGMDNDDMKAATGQYDASLGARSNETSGIAINSRKQQGATATYNYIDNFAAAKRYTYEILVDMIPKVYDTQRVVRILGEDGGEKWKTLYMEVEDPDRPGEKIVLNDISKGKYDVTVTVGQSYATQRMEAVDAFTELAGRLGASYPAIAPLVAYQVIKNLDLPGSEEVEQAFRRGLVAEGLLPPRDGEEGPKAPPPDPRLEATVAKLVADAKKATADARKSDASAAKTEAEAQTVIPLADAEIRQIMAEIAAQEIVRLTQEGRLMLPPQQTEYPPPATPNPANQEPAQAGFLLSGA